MEQRLGFAMAHP